MEEILGAKEKPYLSVASRRLSGLKKEKKNLPSNARGNRGGEGLVPASGRAPGGGNATHSSILAWRIPWTEEPVRLQSTELQRVGHDQSNLAHTQEHTDKMSIPVEKGPPTAFASSTQVS